MSFFDEEDEEPTRAAPRLRVGAGTSSRRSTAASAGLDDHQRVIRQRRLILVFAVIVVVVAIALLVKGCSGTDTGALENYNTSVRNLINQSSLASASVFSALTPPGGIQPSNETSIQNQLLHALRGSGGASSLLAQAQQLSVPSAMASAQQDLVQTLRLRGDATADIEAQIGLALNQSAAVRKKAIDSIAAAMGLFYASDLIYTQYVARELADALNHASVPSQQIAASQVLPDLGWLNVSTVAGRLKVPIPVQHPFIPGLHGHSLDSVSFNGTTLTPAPGTNAAIPASPPPTFTLHFTNGGNFNEYNVVCKVSIAAINDAGRAVVTETYAHTPATCSVALPTKPPTGPAVVTAQILPVEGEKDIANNKLTFTLTFQ